MGKASDSIEPAVAGRSAGGAQDRIRRFAILAVAISQAALFSGGAIATYYLPIRSSLEWQLLLVLGVVSSILCFIAVHRRDRAGLAEQNRIGALVLIVAAVGYLQRVYFAYHGPLLSDPTLSAFRPVVPFFLLIAIGAFALTRTAKALKVIWAGYVLSAIIVLSGLWLHPAISLHRDGVVAVLVWLLLVGPMFILQLHVIPLYEDAFSKTRLELDEVRETAQLAQQLRDSEHRFRLVVSGLQVGIWDFQIVGDQEKHWWSDRFLELLGYSPLELTPSAQAFTALIHPEDQQAVLRIAHDPAQKSGATNINARLLTKSLGYRWFNLRTYWERDADGTPLRAAGAISDIHDRLEADAALKAAQKDLMYMAFNDPLTGIGNRRAFDDRLENELVRCKRNKAPLCLLLIDLDHFKLFNDRYGHSAGDDCLRLVATCIQKHIRRPADFVGRIGGEEFGAILPETPVAGAMVIAQTILTAIQQLQIPHEMSPISLVSASIGVSCTTDISEETQTLFTNADKALYMAKDAGRNGIRNLLEPA